jgi:hypothetical protein
MDDLVRPFVQLWNWITHTGGLPGQILFVCLAIIVVLGVTVWLGNRRIS